MYSANLYLIVNTAFIALLAFNLFTNVNAAYYGKPVKQADGPFVLSIRSWYEGHVAGGVLIKERLALSVAEVFVNAWGNIMPIEYFYIQYDENLHFIQNVVDIKNINVHSSYHPFSLENNVCMIQLFKNSNITDLIVPSPVGCNIGKEHAYKVRLLSHGFDLYNMEFRNVKEVTRINSVVEIKAVQECLPRMSSGVGGSEFCMGSVRNESILDHHDSRDIGNPFFLSEGPNSYSMIGIISYTFASLPQLDMSKDNIPSPGLFLGLKVCYFKVWLSVAEREFSWND